MPRHKHKKTCGNHLLRVGYQRSLRGPDGIDGKDGININGPAPDGLPGADGADGSDGPHTTFSYNVTNGANGVGFMGTPPTTTVPGANGTNGVDAASSISNPTNIEVYYNKVLMTPGVPITLSTIFPSFAANQPFMRYAACMFVAATPDATSAVTIAMPVTFAGPQTISSQFVNVILNSTFPGIAVTATLFGPSPANVMFGFFPLQ